jgi:hypothetical protein
MNIKVSSTCFEQLFVHHQEVCTSSLQYFNVHINRILSATRHFLRCMVKYSKLLIETS